MDNEFSSEENTIISQNNPLFRATIEEIESTDNIKPLRWKAAGYLKEKGTLKEIKMDNYTYSAQDQSDFIFVVEDVNPKEYVVVKKIENHLLRWTINIPNGEEEKEIWNMLNTLHYE